MYFVNLTASKVEMSREGDAVANSGSSSRSSRSSYSSSSSSSWWSISKSVVPGMEMDRLKADEVMWAVYERGWRDAYAAALTALAAVPPSPIPAAPPPPIPAAPPSSLPGAQPLPLADQRPAAIGPVRRPARAGRNAQRRKVSARPSPMKKKSPSTTTLILIDDEEETYRKNCRNWVNGLQKYEKLGPEDIICSGSDVGSFSTVPTTSEEAEDALWKPLTEPCFRHNTTAETAAYKSAWINIPSRDCCDHCLLKSE